MRKEIIKIKVEINKVEDRKILDLFNKLKCWVLGKKLIKQINYQLI